MALRQIVTKSVSARGIMNSRAFVDGFESVRKGKEFNYDYSQNSDVQWAYERGRLLACVYPGKLKQDRRVTYDALFAVKAAMDQGLML